MKTLGFLFVVLGVCVLVCEPAFAVYTGGSGDGAAVAEASSSPLPVTLESFSVE